jgi:hypothetical protein
MKTLKSARVLAASLGVLAVGAMATPAMAFDNVEWSWKKTVNERVDIDVDIDIDLKSTGLVEVEKLQIFFGNVTATSNVHNVQNNQYDPGFEIKYVYCWPVIICNAFDATVDLPSVVSAATAVGNNQSITSDVPVFLHDGQFVANTRANGGNDCDWLCTVKAAMPEADVANIGGGGYGAPPVGNLHTDLALLFSLGAIAGILTPAEISAESNVGYIRNATVDSSATAVANNLSVTLLSNVDGTDGDAASRIIGPPQPGYGDHSLLSNHVVIADITQFAYANVSAVSNVCDVSVDNYKNLSPNTDDLTATLGRPLVSSVATAVGNNVSITVGVPTVE